MLFGGSTTSLPAQLGTAAMNIYDDVLEPGVVSQSCYGHLTTRLHRELLVLRTNILSVYQVEDMTGYLLLTHEFRFDGRVSAMQLIPQTKDHKDMNCLDTLLVCIGNCKYSLVYFEPTTNDLQTLSLHYYEEQFKGMSLMGLASESQLRVDPVSRCVLLFNNDSLAFLPLTDPDDEDEDEDMDEDMDETGDAHENVTKRVKLDDKSASNHAQRKSIIVQGSALHEGIQNIIDIQFLNNFSKPTIALLYQPKLAWVGNAQLNPLPTKFIIISLNLLNSNASGNDSVSISHNKFHPNNFGNIEPTVIAKVEDLTWDYHSLVAVAKGCIVMGDNQLAYIDNTGILQNVILLNSFASKDSIKSKVIDNSKQEIVLNKSCVEHLWCPPTMMTSKANDDHDGKNDGNDEILLLVDEKVNLFYVQLEFEGRLLIRFDIINLPIVNEIFINNRNPTTITRIDTYTSNTDLILFVGFQTGDPMVVKLNNIKSSIETRDEHKYLNDVDQNYNDDNNNNNSNYDDDEIDDDEIDDDDDLYADEPTQLEKDKLKDKDISDEMVQIVQPFDIELLATLNNIGPITSMAVGRTCSLEPTVKGLTNPNKGEYSLVTTSGNGTGSHLTSVQFSIQPVVELALKFISVTQIWNLKFRNKDKYLVTTDSTKAKSEIYEIDNKFALHKGGRLRRDATTVYISMFGDEKRIVQVTTNHLYLFDTNFRRLTTIKFDFEVVHVSVMDPYILITVSRGDIKVYELESKNKKKLFRVDLPEILKEMVITSGLILKSNMCNEYLANLQDSDEEQMLFTFVTADNQIIFFVREHHDRIFQLNGIAELNEQLFISTYTLPEEVIPDPSIKQLMINKLGRYNKEEYLTILTFGGEIYQYKKCTQRFSKFYKNSCRNNLAITGAPDNAYAKGVSSIERIMHYIPNYKGFSVIFITGNVPYMIIKEDDSIPRIFKFANIPLVSMTPWSKQSIMCVDDIKNARVYTLDHDNVYYGNKLPLKRIIINNTFENYMTFTNIAYHEKSELFIVSYSKEVDFVVKGEDGEKIIIGAIDDVPHAKGCKSGIILVNPKTWNVIDQIEFEDDSLVNDVRTMLIQLDSKTKRKIEYVVVGISYIGSEDLPASGTFFMYDIITVVPEPGKPDTNYKFQKFFREDVKSAVTSVCDISGRFVISQSQKLMVRDAQEDNSVVPVAFLDVPLYVTDIKSFGNLLIVGDAMQGIQLIGFDAEPYRMIPLGKSIAQFEVMSVEFLVNQGGLYFAVTDRNDVLHVLKYAPDEPNSLSGQRLIHCSSFNIHSTNSCMTLLPKNDEFEGNDSNRSTTDYDASAATQSYQAIGGQVDGSIFKIVPLREDAYRRLYVIQQQLIDKERSPAGINPRMERLDNEYYHLSHAKRPMLDYNVIKRFASASIPKRAVMSQKVGKRAHFDIWRTLIDLELSLKTLSG